MIRMAAKLILALLVLAVVFHCDCSPIKMGKDIQVVDSDTCLGQDCVNEVTLPEELDLMVLPENFTDVLMSIPTLADGQNQMVTIMNDLQRNQGLLIANQNYLNMSQSSMKESQNMLVGILTNQTVILESMVTALKGIQNKLDLNYPDLITTTRAPEIAYDCADYVAYGYTKSKPYVITSNTGGLFYMYCDMESDGGGWSVIQRRFNGTVDFYRGWDDYAYGFGDAYGEHWVGLELIHTLTTNGTWELRIDLEDFSGLTAFAHYTTFSVENAASNYRLNLWGYRYDSTLGDAMQYNSNSQFSTKDADNNRFSSNCAQDRQGAWWYDNCSYANLNGLYLGPNQINISGMYWWFWKNNAEVLKRSEMKIRRREE